MLTFNVFFSGFIVVIMWRRQTVLSSNDLSDLNVLFAKKKLTFFWYFASISVGRIKTKCKNFLFINLFKYNTFNLKNYFKTSNTTKRNRIRGRCFCLFRYQLYLKVSPSSFKRSTWFCCHFDHDKRQVWYSNPVVWIFMSAYKLRTVLITAGSGCLLNFLMLRCIGLFYYGKNHETLL